MKVYFALVDYGKQADLQVLRAFKRNKERTAWTAREAAMHDAFHILEETEYDFFACPFEGTTLCLYERGREPQEQADD